MAKIKIDIKTIEGTVLFSYESEANTKKKTLEQAVLTGTYLRGADLTGADLTGADLTGADLTGAYLTGAYLTGAVLTGAYLRGAVLTGAYLTGAYLRGAVLTGADLTGADLTGADLTGAYLTGADLRLIKNPEKMPRSWLNLCSRDLLFIFAQLKPELPFLRERLLAGEVNGTQYEGKCACLIGTLANADGGVAKVCNAIPFYENGLHNAGEQWFWNIHKGDKPSNSFFAKHALELIDMVLEKPKPTPKPKRGRI